MTTEYVGRFAPSPTGPLHFGSLVAALGSYLDARSRGGRWLLRMEDIDPPREVAGAADLILRTLDHCGLHWDGPVLYQSSRIEAYRAALDALDAIGATYPCYCTRREVAAAAGIDGPVYPGTCRTPVPGPPHQSHSLRVRTDDEPIRFDDQIQGRFSHRLESEVGDFVVRRADGLFAYQLAVVVDDSHQGITNVVRGVDLLDSTPRQIHLQRLLGLPTPSYAHLPIVTDGSGVKLSKQTGARPLDDDRAAETMVEALRFLGQEPDPALAGAPPATILEEAVARWNPRAIRI